jgi:hypothetical protein
MRPALLFSCAVLMCSICVRHAQAAQRPRINPELKAKQVTIHKVLVLPAQVAYKKIAFRGVEGGTEESDRIATSLYTAVTKELSVRGVDVQPNPLDAARTDKERYAIAGLQTRYDTVGVQLRKNPRWVEHGRITLDDRVARFGPATGLDAIVFVRGNGANKTPFGTLSMMPFHAEVTFVDAKTGEVLAFVRFGIFQDVAKETEERLAHDLRDAMHEVPLPAPPPKK